MATPKRTTKKLSPAERQKRINQLRREGNKASDTSRKPAERGFAKDRINTARKVDAASEKAQLKTFNQKALGARLNQASDAAEYKSQVNSSALRGRGQPYAGKSAAVRQKGLLAKLGRLGKAGGKAGGALGGLALGITASQLLDEYFEERREKEKMNMLGGLLREGRPSQSMQPDPGINPTETRNRRMPETQGPVEEPKLTPDSFRAPQGTPVRMTRDQMFDTTQRQYGPNQVGGEMTKAGYYPSFKKESMEAQDFRSAFANAVATKQSSFPWQGRLYNTNIKKDK